MGKYKSLLLEIGMAIILVLGIALSILSNFVVELSPLIGYALTVIPLLWYLVREGSKLLWAEPNVVMVPITEDRDYRRGYFPRIARLEIYNDEEIEITDCYVTLEFAKTLYATRDMIFVDVVKDERLRWKDKRFSNDRCEITIPPKKSLGIDILDSTDGIRFSLCTPTLRTANSFGERLFILKIRVDGKFNGKNIKPQYFEGYIFVENKPDVFEAVETTREQIGDGEVKETQRNIRERLVYTDMLFEKGNWMENEKLKKTLGIPINQISDTPQLHQKG